MNTEAYYAISEFYGDKRANRSNVLLMNHINEGLIILNIIGADLDTKDAFCLHPILQNDIDLHNAINTPLLSRYALRAKSIILAMEYRVIANTWLSNRWDDMNNINLGPLALQIKQMLIADKVQNYKDFMLYHKSTHKRAFELETYFQKWFLALGISSFTVVDLIRKVQENEA